MNERLYRSRDDRIIAGVAGGVAQQFRIDPSLVRILWVILTIPTGGLALLLYILMAFIVPEEPAGDARWASWDRGSGGYGWPDQEGPSPSSGGSPAMDPAAMGGVNGREWSNRAAPAADPAAMGGMPAGIANPVSPTPAAGSAPATDGGPLGVPPGFVGGGTWSGGGTSGPAADPRTAWREQRSAMRDERRAWRDERRAARHEHRDGFGALLFGLILILVGAYFLVRAYVPAIDADRSWPFLLLAIGVVLLFGAIRRSNGPDGPNGPSGPNGPGAPMGPGGPTSS